LAELALFGLCAYPFKSLNEFYNKLIISVTSCLIICGNLLAQSPFSTYKALPILPSTPYVPTPQPSILDEAYRNQRQQLELDILRAQRDYLNGLNNNVNTDRASPSQVSNFNIVRALLVNSNTGNIIEEHTPTGGKLYYKPNDYVHILMPDVKFENKSRIVNEVSTEDMFLMEFSETKGLAVLQYLEENKIMRLALYDTSQENAIIIDVTSGDVTNNTSPKSNRTPTNNYPTPVPQHNKKQKVYTFSPIVQYPKFDAKEVGRAENEEVIVIEKVNERYYKVQSGSVIGYMSDGWFRK